MNRYILSRTAVILAGLGCVLNAGCGYRVGPVLKANYRSVAVPMFGNKTYKPQVEAQITNGIIKRLQADGTLRVDSMARADIVVTGDIIRYNRLELRLAQQDTKVPREYRLVITVHVARICLSVQTCRAPSIRRCRLRPTTWPGRWSACWWKAGRNSMRCAQAASVFNRAASRDFLRDALFGWIT